MKTLLVRVMLWAIAAPIIMIVSVLIFGFLYMALPIRTTFCTFTLDNSCTVRVTEDVVEPEYSKLFLVVDDGKGHKIKTDQFDFLGHAQKTYRAWSNPTSDVIGISEAMEPERMRALVSLESNEYWTQRQTNETEMAVGNRLLQRIQLCFPGKQLTLKKD